jgi:hypothetical protein
VTKHKGLVQQRQRQLPDKAIPAPEKPRWYPPEPTPEFTEYKINLPIPGVGRIIGRTQHDESQRMTEFALTAQVYHADAWWDVVRVDTAHGAVHAHYMYRTRDYEVKEPIRDIYSQNDVDTGYQLAETLLIANWEDNIARWKGAT